MQAGDSSIVANGNGEDKHGFHGVMRAVGWESRSHVLDPLRDSSLMLRPRSGRHKSRMTGAVVNDRAETAGALESCIKTFFCGMRL
jgi:hypothetical protein